MDDFTTVNVSKKTPTVLPLDALPTLDPAVLDAASVRAAEEFVADGTPANTARSYASALRYWAAWYALRYGQPLGGGPLPVTVATQFVLDHLQRQTKAGLTHELPPALDARLVAFGAKAQPGPLAYATVGHRLAVLANFSGGIDKFVGPTGGFLISFPIMAYIIGLGVEHRDAFKGAFPVAVVVGTVVNYIVGVILFVIVAHSTVSVAVSACVLPFIPTAIIKAVLACVLGLNIRKRIPGVKKA